MQKRQLGCFETLVIAIGIFSFFGGCSAYVTVSVASLFLPLFAEFSKTTVSIPLPIFYLFIAAFGFAILIAAGIIGDLKEYQRKSESEKA